MKHIYTFTVVATIAMIISACGAPAAPTMNAADVQSTAVAAAFTMVAQTQAAVPTATPLPPTETPTQTPAVTNTPLPLPTLNVTLGPTLAPTTAASGNPCDTRVLSAPDGRETIIRIANKTNVPIKVSIYLNETEGRGACGWGYVEIAKNNDTVISNWVQGCYNLWAWSDDPRGKFNSSGGGCINNSDKWTFEVSAATIKFVGP